MVKHNGVLYRAADAHAHIYPGKIAEKATENGRFYKVFQIRASLFGTQQKNSAEIG